MIANPVTLPLSEYQAQHVRLDVDGKVASLSLNRPDFARAFAAKQKPVFEGN
jgi:hypothetical protein